MNDSQPKIAFIQSRLPYIDRRALSEAWFSALHMASDGRPAAAAPERRVATFDRALRPSAYAAAGPRTVPTSAPQAPLRVARATAPAAVPEALPAGRKVASRQSSLPPRPRAERAAAPFRTSLTIALDTGRVQLLLRREGGTLHVIALCRPGVAETVRRALALADAHLRIAGNTVRSSVRACEGTEVFA